MMESSKLFKDSKEYKLNWVDVFKKQGTERDVVLIGDVEDGTCEVNAIKDFDKLELNPTELEEYINTQGFRDELREIFPLIEADKLVDYLKQEKRKCIVSKKDDKESIFKKEVKKEFINQLIEDLKNNKI